MPSPSDGAEKQVRGAVEKGLRSWLKKAKEAVLTPWRRFRAQPNADNIKTVVPAWQAEVDRIMSALTPALREGWAAADLPGDLELDDPYIQANLALTKNLLVQIPDEVHAMVVRAIFEGVSKAETMEQIARRVQDVLDYTGSQDWPSRARTIAQTETNRHFNSSMLAHGLLREKQGVVGLRKRWDTRMDGKERPAHHQANNQEQPLLQPFLVGGEKLMFPVDPTGRPDNVINCVTGSTPICAQGVSGAYRFTWSGPLATVRGERGLRLTASPNHPVLTERGWVTVRELQQSDHLICTRLGNRYSGTTPDVQGPPPCAEEVFLALESIAHYQRVNGLPVNFYGDRPDGEVDIVLVDRELDFGVDSSVREPFEKLAFAYANSPAAAGSSVNEFFFGARLSPDRSMSGGHLPFALLRTEVLPFNSFTFGLGTGPDSQLQETSAQGVSIDPQLLSQGVEGSTCEILLSKVEKVDFHSSGHVSLYTFQTSSGIYLADGIVSHNCRCELRLLGDFT